MDMKTTERLHFAPVILNLMEMTMELFYTKD